MIVGLCGVAGSGKDTVADFLVKSHSFTKVAFADPLKRICKDVFAFTDEQLWGPSEKRNAPDERYPREHAWKPITQEVLAGGYVGHTDVIGHVCAHCGVKESDEVPQCYLTPRYALQQLGSEWGRDCYQNVWVDYALRTAQQLLGPEGHKFVYTAKNGLFDQSTARFRVTVIGQEPWKAKGVVISDVRFRNEIEAIQKAGGKVVRIVRKDAGLKGAASTHASETEQQSIPDSAFDFNLINGGKSLDLLEASVSGLVEVMGL